MVVGFLSNLEWCLVLEFIEGKWRHWLGRFSRPSLPKQQSRTLCNKSNHSDIRIGVMIKFSVSCMNLDINHFIKSHCVCVCVYCSGCGMLIHNGAQAETDQADRQGPSGLNGPDGPPDLQLQNVPQSDWRWRQRSKDHKVTQQDNKDPKRTTTRYKPTRTWCQTAARGHKTQNSYKKEKNNHNGTMDTADHRQLFREVSWKAIGQQTAMCVNSSHFFSGLGKSARCHVNHFYNNTGHTLYLGYSYYYY